MRMSIVISMCGLIAWMTTGCRFSDHAASVKPQPVLSPSGFVDLSRLIEADPDYRLVRKTDAQLAALQYGVADFSPVANTVDIGALAPGAIRLDTVGPAYSRESFAARLNEKNVLLRDLYRKRAAQFNEAALTDSGFAIMAEVQSGYNKEREILSDSSSENLVKILGSEADNRIVLEMQIAALKQDSLETDAHTAPPGYWASRLAQKQQELVLLDQRRKECVDALNVVQRERLEQLRQARDREASSDISTARRRMDAQSEVKAADYLRILSERTASALAPADEYDGATRAMVASDLAGMQTPSLVLSSNVPNASWRYARVRRLRASIENLEAYRACQVVLISEKTRRRASDIAKRNHITIRAWRPVNHESDLTQSLLMEMR